nr:uncharacterized protein LOC129283373 [Lytechinus pictus]
MKHRSNKVNFLSYSSHRKRRGNRRKVREPSKSLSTSTVTLPGLHEQTDGSRMEFDVSQMLLDYSLGDHIQELDRSSSSSGSMIPFMDTSSWLAVAGEMSLTKLPSTLYHVCNWWKTKVNESLEFAKDVVFPSRVYRRELYATQEQIALLQEQLQRIREEMESKVRAFNQNRSQWKYQFHWTS